MKTEFHFLCGENQKMMSGAAPKKMRHAHASGKRCVNEFTKSLAAAACLGSGNERDPLVPKIVNSAPMNASRADVAMTYRIEAVSQRTSVSLSSRFDHHAPKSNAAAG